MADPFTKNSPPRASAVPQNDSFFKTTVSRCGPSAMNVVHCEASVVEASRRMRQCGASDIVTRVVALGLDPSVLTAGDIASFAEVN